MATQSFINVLVKNYGMKEISSAIAQLRRRLDTVQPVLKDIGQLYVDEAKYRIQTQTDPQGRVWKHNTKVTQGYKAYGLKSRYTGKVMRGPAKEGKNKRLVWTGKLRNKLKYRVGGNTVYVLSDVPYATTQQFGAEIGSFRSGDMTTGEMPIPWGNIPARPFLGTNKKTNEQVASKLGEYLLGNKIAKQLGFSS